MLGFGTARLPGSDESSGVIDEAETIKMLRCAIDNGVNYLDMGYPYNLARQEQVSRVISRALRDGYRDKVKITATVPHFLVDSPDDFDSYLDRQLKWLDAEKIDFVLLGRLDRYTWPKMQNLNIIDRAEAAIANECIGGIGFAFHDHFMTLREVLDAYEGWTLAQFQYSYMDVDHHPGIGGLRYAAGKGLAVVVTEPLKVGRLTREPPESVVKVWAEASAGRTSAGWGLGWVWNHPEVATVVSDMSTMKQLEENLALADAAEPDSFSISEQIIVGKVRDAYRSQRELLCTSCRGCMPCPLNIDVPRIFELYNDAVMYGDIEAERQLYKYEGHDIYSCNECGVCAAACGFKFAIPAWLKKAKELLDR